MHCLHWSSCHQQEEEVEAEQERGGQKGQREGVGVGSEEDPSYVRKSRRRRVNTLSGGELARRDNMVASWACILAMTDGLTRQDGMAASWAYSLATTESL